MRSRFDSSVGRRDFRTEIGTGKVIKGAIMSWLLIGNTDCQRLGRRSRGHEFGRKKHLDHFIVRTISDAFPGYGRYPHDADSMDVAATTHTQIGKPSIPYVDPRNEAHSGECGLRLLTYASLQKWLSRSYPSQLFAGLVSFAFFL